jgi:hypothetical protein
VRCEEDGAGTASFAVAPSWVVIALTEAADAVRPAVLDRERCRLRVVNEGDRSATVVAAGGVSATSTISVGACSAAGEVGAEISVACAELDVGGAAFEEPAAALAEDSGRRGEGAFAKLGGRMGASTDKQHTRVKHTTSVINEIIQVRRILLYEHMRCTDIGAS